MIRRADWHRRVDGKNIMFTNEKSYVFPEAGTEKLPGGPVIVGSGPAGLVCAWMLARHGYRPLLLERGDEASVRKEKVDRFWAGEPLDPQSNVQFGEGAREHFPTGS